jgi:hypothetical protein
MADKNPITQEELKSKLYYDSDTGIFTWIKSNKIAGYSREDGYSFIRLPNKLYRTHKLAWLYMYGKISKKEIDHIDGNPKNNAINNLRLCTSSQNKYNTKLRKDNTIGIKGVYWYKKSQKWHVKLNYNKKHLHLGYFQDFFEACCIIISARNKLHKEFANHGY